MATLRPVALAMPRYMPGVLNEYTISPFGVTTITPPLPGADQNAARALGRERFEAFVTQVGRRVATGGRLVAEVMEKIAAANPDAFARSDEPMGQAREDRASEQDPPAHADADGTPEPSPAGRGEVGHV